MKRRLFLAVLLVLNGCVPMPEADIATGLHQPSPVPLADSTLPPIKSFTSHAAQISSRPNADIAADFLDLAFQMESGRALPVLTRFEGPIRVRVTGKPPDTLHADLARLLSRLRSEAGIDIQRSDAPTAQVTIQAVPRDAIRAVLPQAACFVAPNVSNLAEYRSAQRSARTDWTQLVTRKKMAVFVPNDVSPQEARDCLHEEIAQALGPLNDIYRLPDSVFNDDNIHTILTGFDMLILRAYYDSDLRSGMTRAQVATRLPRILARINPAGAASSFRTVRSTPKEWSDAIQIALGPGSSPAQRQRAAQRAVQIANRQGWHDNRTAFANYTLGRVLQKSNPVAAEHSFVAADRLYALTPGHALHRAYIATQLAAFALRRADGKAALHLVTPHISTAHNYENAALLATLLLIRAEALELESRAEEAHSVRLDSIGWARYGFGPDWAVQARLREIATLNPRKG